jgi:hypothetical protein
VFSFQERGVGLGTGYRNAESYEPIIYGAVCDGYGYVGLRGFTRRQCTLRNKFTGYMPTEIDDRSENDCNLMIVPVLWIIVRRCETNKTLRSVVSWRLHTFGDPRARTNQSLI